MNRRPALAPANIRNTTWRCRSCGRETRLSRAAREMLHSCPNLTRFEVPRFRLVHDQQPCVTCGHAFVPRRSDARYCSGACRQAAYRSRQVEART